MPDFEEVLTPRHHPLAHEHIDGAATRTHMERQQQQLQDTSEQRLQLERMRYRAQLDQRRTQSEMSSYVRDVDSAHSVARVYKPNLQERARATLEGRWGLYLEITNFALSVLIFSMYVAELYDDDLHYSASRRSVEVIITSFFVFDLALHLFVALSPWRYLFSIHGIIDLLTVIPSLVVFLVPATRSQLFFVLRVLRIFRALRVLRLKQFLRFKKSKFDYELAVFILSSVAVILCAAGMFHALEESYYISTNEILRFHEALYFVLVTTATIGYGDISPHTTMGQLFVIVLILGIFTVVPHEVSKLNELAKQTHAWDKDYSASKTRASGHVIVASDALSTDAALDFLHEFYHASRGSIHLDVVFLSDTPPAPALARLLATDKYRWRTRYLRGSIANAADQRRVQLGDATAVFLLANKQLPRGGAAATQDAATILHTLAVRNFADSYGTLMDIYTQLLSHAEQHETASLYLGANTTKTSKLKIMLLARAAVCPGASTLILNLLQSVDAAEYSKRVSWRKLWIQEYVDGMCHQIFPMVFTEKFQFEKFEDVVRNVYERYGSILFTVFDKKAQRRGHGGGGGSPGASSTGCSVPIAPFQSYICEGDIGFVIAKTASVVLHIVNTYGYWREAEQSSECLQVLTTNVLPVRVSSDTLLRRPSHQSSSRESARVVDAHSRRRHPGGSSSDAESARMDLRARKWREYNDDVATMSDSGRAFTSAAGMTQSPGAVMHSVNTAPVRVTLRAIDEDSTAGSSGANAQDASPAHGSRVVEAARLRDVEQVRAALERDHFRADTKYMSGHYVVCAGLLSEALSLVHSLRAFYEYERDVCVRAQSATTATNDSSSRSGAMALQRKSQQLSVRVSHRCFVLLMHALPDVNAVMRVLEESDGSERLLEGVYFVTGSSARTSDLVRTGAPRARHVLVLPVEEQQPAVLAASQLTEPTTDAVSLADFGVISSMLAVEIARQQLGKPRRASPVSPRRRRLTSRSLSADFALSADAPAPSYQREVDQGLPIESVKLRMLERFPDLDPTVFRERGDVIEARLHDQLDAKQSNASELAGGGTVVAALQAAENTLGVLEHALNARFCRPRDHEVCHDELPCLAPSFASGSVFLSSLLDRIVCQSFYNPYITDLVEALAAGSTAGGGGPVTVAPAMAVPHNTSFGTSGARRGSMDASAARHRRLFRIQVDDVFVGGKFLDVFVELLRLDMLAIAILRSPNTAVLENLLPYVYTCPDPETTLHASDRIFVLG